jgi:hypothetical protein
MLLNEHGRLNFTKLSGMDVGRPMVILKVLRLSGVVECVTITSLPIQYYASEPCSLADFCFNGWMLLHRI